MNTDSKPENAFQTSFTLAGKKGLVVGIANDRSIAHGCARVARKMGAELAITYLNDKSKRFVEPLAEELGAEIFLPCDVRESGQLKEIFDRIADRWGKLDFVLHSIAFAPREDLHGRVVDCTRVGFQQAMDISCHSFIRMTKYAEPLMKGGGSLITVSFYGAEKVVEHYNLMGPVKAALQSATKYMAAELGEKGIRVNCISPGPLATRAASGIDRFDELMEKARERAPTHHLVTVEDIGNLAAFSMCDASRSITGEIAYVDGGYNIVG